MTQAESVKSPQPLITSDFAQDVAHQPPASKLYAELWDHIVGYLGDRISLQNCSLVCRSWEPSASLHLFSSLTFNPVTLVATPENPNFRPIYFELKTIPRISSNVRKLSLSNAQLPYLRHGRHRGKEDVNEAQPNYSTLSVFHTDLLADIVATFPQLQELRLCLPSKYTVGSDERLSSLSLTRPNNLKLQHLSISLLPFTLSSPPGVSLRDITEIFDSVQSLHMRRGRSQFPISAPQPMLAPKLRVRHLQWSFPDTAAADALRLLLSAIDISGLETLTIEKYGTIPTLKSIGMNGIIAHAPELQHFSLEVDRALILDFSDGGPIEPRAVVMNAYVDCAQQTPQLHSIRTSLHSLLAHRSAPCIWISQSVSIPLTRVET